jgi:hypothetical protein
VVINHGQALERMDRIPEPTRPPNRGIGAVVDGVDGPGSTMPRGGRVIGRGIPLIQCLLAPSSNTALWATFMADR